MGKRSLDFGMEQLPALRRLLKDTGFDDVAINDISKVHIDCYASADHRFVAIQVLQYGALSDRPLTPAGYLYEDRAESFLKEFTAEA